MDSYDDSEADALIQSILQQTTAYDLATWPAFRLRPFHVALLDTHERFWKQKPTVELLKELYKSHAHLDNEGKVRNFTCFWFGHKLDRYVKMPPCQFPTS